MAATEFGKPDLAQEIFDWCLRNLSESGLGYQSNRTTKSRPLSIKSQIVSPVTLNERPEWVKETFDPSSQLFDAPLTY